MVNDLETVLARLTRSGSLTAQTRAELVELTRAHLTRVHALTEAQQAVLVRLAGRYDPRAAPRLWVRLVAQRRQQRISI